MGHTASPFCSGRRGHCCWPRTPLSDPSPGAEQPRAEVSRAQGFPAHAPLRPSPAVPGPAPCRGLGGARPRAREKAALGILSQHVLRGPPRPAPRTDEMRLSAEALGRERRRPCRTGGPRCPRGGSAHGGWAGRAPGGCGAVRSPRTQASTLTSSWELEVTYQLCSADLSPMRRNLNLLPHSAQHRQAWLRPGTLRAPEAGTPRPGGAPLGGPGHGLRAESCARCIGGQG